MAGDNRKTYRLEDRAQEILIDIKDRRGCTENEAVNYIIQTFPEQGKKITELHNDKLTLIETLQADQRRARDLEKELEKIKTTLRFFGSLVFDSNSFYDQPGAGTGQA